MSMPYDSFATLLEEHGLELSEHQYDQFNIYYETLISWNDKINLTAITEREAVFIKHFYDSLSLSFFCPLTSVETLADIGSGAGFPGIPLKIMFPHIQLTIIDSLNKRIRFLEHVITELELSGVQCLHSRAEDAARLPHLRDQFDLVTARAVARLPVLNEICLPFVKKDGLFVAMKGADGSTEIEESRRSLRELKAAITDVHTFQLPFEQSDRQLIVMTKLTSTPHRYPRKAGTPARNPL